MDLAQIRELLKIVAESGVAEVEIEEKDLKLVVRKTTTPVMMQLPPAMPAYGMNFAAPAYPHAPPLPPIPSYSPPPQPYPVATVAQPQAQAPPVAPAVQNNTPPPQQEAEPSPPVVEGSFVRAPIVGTFYSSPAPDADPYIQVGDKVKPGDVLCIIEAMKLMNEIECEVSGTVKEILIQNAEPVEYDQPLFVVEEL